MISQEWILIATIAILYSYFFKKLADVVVNSHSIVTMCEQYGGYGGYGGFTRFYNSGQRDNRNYQEWEKCRKIKKQKSDKADSKKFVILLAAGVAGAIMASQVAAPAASVGVGIGGVLTVLYATYVYWSHFNEIMKLGATGVSLAALIYTSIKFYHGQNLLNLFR